MFMSEVRIYEPLTAEIVKDVYVDMEADPLRDALFDRLDVRVLSVRMNLYYFSHQYLWCVSGVPG